MQSTTATAKRLSVPVANPMAARTGLGCVGRVDQNNWNTSDRRLIGEERPELIEAPSMMLSALSLSHLGPLANAGQVFECDRAAGGNCFRYDAFRDGVIGGLTKPRFLAAEPPKQPSGRLGAFALDRATRIEITFPDCLSLAPLPRQPCTGVGYVPASKVYPDNLWRFAGGRGVKGDLDLDVVISVAALHQNGAGGLLVSQQRPLVVTNGQRQLNRTIQQRHPDKLFILPEIEGASVQRQARRVELPDLVASLQGTHNAPDSLTGMVSLEAIQRPDVVIDQVMQLSSVALIVLTRHLQHMVTAVRKRFKSGVDPPL